MTMKRKIRGMGRKTKIEIKPIEKEEARQVCFSKRRAGIFNKANELSTLCGAEVGVVLFSPAGRPFSFGHPSVNATIDRFLLGVPPAPDADDHRTAPPPPPLEEAPIRDLTRQHHELCDRLKELQLRRDFLRAAMRAGEVAEPFLLDSHVEELGMADAERFLAGLERLRSDILQRQEALRLGFSIGAAASGVGESYNE